MLNRKIHFWKLLGCGKNGAFDITPDWRQWGLLSVYNDDFINDQTQDFKLKTNNSKLQTQNFKLLYGSFISRWWKFFRCEVFTIILEPLEGHGRWDGKEVFGTLPKHNTHAGITAVLTRATIRLSQLKNFWKNAKPVAATVANARGFIMSVGIGEVPWVKQATFSVWETSDAMKQFAYKMKTHTDVIAKTRREHWYGEEMFVRFKILAVFGTLHGINPLMGKL